MSFVSPGITHGSSICGRWPTADPAWAWLAGSGWGPWRGAWTSNRRLRPAGSSWELLENEVPKERFADLAIALDELFDRRVVRDHRPWAILALSYEELAELEDLPRLEAKSDIHRGTVLLEPEAADVRLASGRRSQQSASSLSHADSVYAEAVSRALEEIQAGELYQVNLTRRFCLDGWNGGLAPLVEALESVDQTPPYLGALAIPGEDRELLVASMELMLSKRGPRMVTRPIKGTRRRGIDPAEDRLLIRELETSKKERAELAMVVDLERNDLGRLAEPGSVRVSEPGTITTWGHLHHRWAEVEARLRGAPALSEILRTMFPGGSVTGCPKRAAMRLIAELEACPRGLYTGAFGVVDGRGELEIALPIRTAARCGEKLEISSGCGIVWGSDPQAEEAESRLKVAPWLELLGLTSVAAPC